MPITAQSRFSKVQVEYNEGYDPPSGSVSWESTDVVSGDSDIWYWSLARNEPTLANTHPMSVLRAIYNSDDGILDTDGDPLSISFVNYPYPIDSITDLEVNGFYNPFDTGSRERLINLWKQNGDRLRENSRNVGTTGLSTHQSKIGVHVQGRTPNTNTMSFSLADSAIYSVDSTSFRVGVHIPTTPPIPGTTAGQDTARALGRMQAIRALLVTSKTAGDAIESGAWTFGGNREFTWTVNGTAIVFTIDALSQSFSVQGGVINFYSFIAEIKQPTDPNEPANTYDRDELTTWIRAQTATIAKIVDGEKPQLKTDGRAEAESIRLGVDPTGTQTDKRVEIINEDGTLFARTTDREVPLSRGLGRGTEHLEVYSDEDTDDANDPDLWMPSPAKVEVVHLSPGSTTKRARWRRIQDQISPGVYLQQSIHHKAITSVHFALEDPAGNEIIKLAADERLTLEFGHREDGVAEMIGIHVPRRWHRWTAGSIGNMGLSHHFDFSSSHWLRPWNVPDLGGAAHEDNYSIAGDAFEKGSTEHAGGASWSSTTYATFAAMPQCLKVRRTGQLLFYQHMELEITQSGNIPTHYTQLYVVRQIAGGTQIAPFSGRQSYVALSGTGTTNDYTILALGGVLKGDVLVPAFLYSKGTSMNPGSINVGDFNRIVYLDQQIKSTFAAS